MSKKIIIETLQDEECRITILDSTTNVFIEGMLRDNTIDIMFEDPSNNNPVTSENCLLFSPICLLDENGRGFSEYLTYTDLGDCAFWIVLKLLQDMIKTISSDLTSVLCKALNAPEECYKIDLTELESKWQQDFIDQLKTEKYNQLLKD